MLWDGMLRPESQQDYTPMVNSVQFQPPPAVLNFRKLEWNR